MQEPKVIKRYANRKLYDTERSCYVTLDEIAQMIKDGDDLQVIDNKSKDDLTAVTLAQIIVEEEKKVSRMPLKLLRNIIQSGEAIGDAYQKKVIDPVAHFRDDVQRRVEGLIKKETKDGAAEEGVAQDSIAQDGAAETDDDKEEKSGVVREFVQSSQVAFDNWQKSIDEKVKDAFSKMGHLNMKALSERLDQLESKVSDYEQRQG